MPGSRKERPPPLFPNYILARAKNLCGSILNSLEVHSLAGSASAVAKNIFFWGGGIFLLGDSLHTQLQGARLLLHIVQDFGYCWGPANDPGSFASRQARNAANPTVGSLVRLFQSFLPRSCEVSQQRAALLAQ